MGVRHRPGVAQGGGWTLGSTHSQIPNGADPLLQAPVDAAAGQHRVLADQGFGARMIAGLQQQQATATGTTVAVDQIAAADPHPLLTQLLHPGTMGFQVRGDLGVGPAEGFGLDEPGHWRMLARLLSGVRNWPKGSAFNRHRCPIATGVVAVDRGRWLEGDAGRIVVRCEQAGEDPMAGYGVTGGRIG